MKRILTIGWLLLALLFACTPKGDDGMVETQNLASLQTTSSPALSAIDSLLWQRPDSALAVLMDYFDCRDVACNVSNTNDTIMEDVARYVSTATTYDRHYAHILLAELLYKNYYDQTNRDELLQAVAYFDSLLLADTRGVSLRQSPRRDALHASATRPQSTAFLDARAHHINGAGYFEQDSLASACREYLKALEVMEEHFEEKDLVGKKAEFMALIYTHLAVLFSDLYLHEQAIYFAKLSIPYYQKQASPFWHLSWILNEIGSHYDMMDVLDSADFYYNQAIAVLNDTNSIMYRDIAIHKACLEYKQNPQQADATALRLSQLLSESGNDLERIARYMTIGEFYYHELLYDSAWNYLNTAYHETTNIVAKKQLAGWLVEICQTEGKTEDIIDYASFLATFATQDEDKGVIKSQVVELYYKFKQQTLEHQNRLRAKKQVKLSVGVVAVLLTLILGVFILYRKYKIKKQHLEIIIKKEQHVHETMQKALSGRLKQSNEALRTQKEIANRLAKVIDVNGKQKEWNHLDDFMNESICHEIVALLQGKQIKRETKSNDYPELRLNDTQLNDLSIAVDKHFCGFEKALSDLYPKINRNTMNQCLLYLLNLEDVQIAALLSCDYSTVKRRSSKLKEAFKTEKEPRQFVREFVL